MNRFDTKRSKVRVRKFRYGKSCQHLHVQLKKECNLKERMDKVWITRYPTTGYRNNQNPSRWRSSKCCCEFRCEIPRRGVGGRGERRRQGWQRDTGEKPGSSVYEAQNRGSSHANPQNQPPPLLPHFSCVVAVLGRRL